MFSKTVLLSAIVLGFANQAFGHAAIQPQLGILGNSTRSDVQQPSTSSPCGNTDIASNINNSTAVALDSTNSFSTSIVNFNGAQDGSTQVTAQVDPTGTGKSFTSATVTQNGQLAPPAAGSAELSVSLPSGTKCTGGTAGNLCLVSFKTAGNFGNCIVVSQTNNAAATGGSAAGASAASNSTAASSSVAVASVAASSAAAATDSTAAASTAAASTGNSTTTTTGKKHKGHHKGGKKGAAAASGAATNDAVAAAGGKTHKGHKHHKGAANSTAAAAGAAGAGAGAAAAADTSVAAAAADTTVAAAASTSVAAVAARAHKGAAAATGGKKHKAHGSRAPRALLERVASEGADCVGNTKRGLLGWIFA